MPATWLAVAVVGIHNRYYSKSKVHEPFFRWNSYIRYGISDFIIITTFIFIIISLNIQNKGHRSVIGVGIAVDGDKSYMIYMIEYEKEWKHKRCLHILYCSVCIYNRI